MWAGQQGMKGDMEELCANEVGGQPTHTCARARTQCLGVCNCRQ